MICEGFVAWGIGMMSVDPLLYKRREFGICVHYKC
jgi:hypothetical protein